MPSWDLGWHHQQMAIWWIVIVVAALLVLTLMWRGRSGSNERRESPEEVLKRRFANGEIDEKTYEHMLEELRK